MTFDEGVSLFVQRTAMGQTPGDVCARLNELTALMQHKNMQSGQRRSCLTGFWKMPFSGRTPPGTPPWIWKLYRFAP